MDDSRTDFEIVVNAHGPGMFRYAFWLCGDRSMAEDLVQETFLRAWRFRDGLNDKGKVKAWLITTLRREHARLFERYRPEFVDLEPEQLADPRARTGNEWESWDLRRVIARLPERLREPLVLQVIFGCNGLEISRALGLPRSTVNTRLFRARQKLCDLAAENPTLLHARLNRVRKAPSRPSCWPPTERARLNSSRQGISPGCAFSHCNPRAGRYAAPLSD